MSGPAAQILRESLEEGLSSSGVTGRVLGAIELKALAELVTTCYAVRPGYALWVRLGATGVYNPSAWCDLGALVGDRQVMLLLELGGEFAGTAIAGESLIELLNEIPISVFYVTDSDARFLIAFNDHDFLIVEDPDELLAYQGPPR